MIVRKLAIRGKLKAGAPGTKPKKKRLFLFVLLTLGAGALAELIALAGPGLVTDVKALITESTQAHSTSQIGASTLFPPVPAQHKVVDVYDPAPPRSSVPQPVAPVAPVAAPPPTPRSSPTPRHSPSPRPRTSPSPRPSPSPGD